MESERHVAARCTTHPESMAEVLAAGLRPDSFADPRCAAVVGVCFDLFTRGALTSHHVVRAELIERKLLPEEGFETWWTDLLGYGWSDPDLPYHAKRVKTTHEVRRAGKVMRLAVETFDSEAALSEKREAMKAATTGLLEIQSQDTDTVRRATDLAAAMEADLENETPARLYEPTGLMSFDRVFRGLPIGRITVVSARMNHGKTMMSDQIGINIARRYARRAEQKLVLKFDLEQGDAENRVRLTSNLSGMAVSAVADHLEHKRRLNPPELVKVREGIRELETLPFVLDGNASADSAYIRARTMAESARMPVALVMVDYIELVAEKGKDKMTQVMNALTGIHALAKDLSIPVIVVSQLNRNAASRSDGIPHLADLSWSDSLAKYSSMVIMLHHEWMHWEQTGRDYDQPQRERITAFVRKNKGPCGASHLNMDWECLRIIDPEELVYGDGMAFLQPDDRPF